MNNKQFDEKVREARFRCNGPITGECGLKCVLIVSYKENEFGFNQMMDGVCPLDEDAMPILLEFYELGEMG